MAASSSSASSSYSCCCKYDVFLSFKDEDTGSNFTSHLFSALQRNGIDVFKDDPRLKRGELITLELQQAIEESRCSVVVLSRTYAFSARCLEELIHIFKCRKSKGHQVFPVFYDVDPSDVRRQKGQFQEAFSKHEETFKNDEERIRNWKNVLTETANLSGWHIGNCGEVGVIQAIVKEISIKLSASYRTVTSNLFGINRQLEQLKEKLCLESEDVRFIGIWGMGGIGKTTLARVAYDYASQWIDFDGKSFLANVRGTFQKEKCILPLQKQLLSQTLMEEPLCMNLWTDEDGANIIRRMLPHRKVLVVIDDVDDIDQLTNLAANPDWFGLGSKIIITSRDQHLLITCGVQTENIYQLTPLNCHESLQLIAWHAFKRYEIPESFEKFCNQIVRYCEGLPLALKVLGSSLYRSGVNEWESTIRRLEKNVEDKIFNVLQISFDGLHETEKDIFLDVACFFQGKEVNYVTEILDACGFEPIISVSVLVEKCLLSREHNNFLMQEHFRMHDLLQEMGRKLVKLESNDPGKRSRLWEENDILDVFTKNSGTEYIEGIMCEGIVRQEIQVDAEPFLKMTRLRLLRVDNLIFSHDLTYLPSTLRLLDWHGYPFQYLPSNFQPDELIRIKMPSSCIVELWGETKHPSKLTSIDLRDSQNLIKVPDFEDALNLKFINFNRCPRLLHVDPSVGSLHNLRKLSFKDCRSLESLPENLEKLICLQTLDVSGTAIRRLPSMFGLKNLEFICLIDCERLLEIHPSIGTLQRLRKLYLSLCTSLRSLPNSVKGLVSLEWMDLHGCSMLESLPEDLGEVKNLRELRLYGTGICQLPPSVRSLTNLEGLYLDKCSLSETDISHVSNLLSLKDLHLSNLNIESLPELPHIARLEICNCKMLKSVSSLSSLSSLGILVLSDCNLSDEAIFSCDFGLMSSLRTLNLSGNSFSILPPSINQLSMLEELNLENCKRLESLPSLSALVSLYILNLKNCELLKSLPCLSGLNLLRKLDLSNCNLSEEALVSCDIGFLTSLTDLNLSKNSFSSLPPCISQLSNLEALTLENCKRLESLPLAGLVSLWALNLQNCEQLKSLPRLACSGLLPFYLDLSHCNLLEEAFPDDFLIGCALPLRMLDLSSNNFTSLPRCIGHISRIYQLYLENCKRLQSIPKLPSNASFVSARGCISLEILPDSLPKRLNLENCSKLMLNQGCNSLVLPLLKRYFQEPSKSSQKFWFCVPGSEMPKWFQHQREGNGITIQVPSNTYSVDSSCKGLIMCFEYTFDDRQQLGQDANYIKFFIHIVVDGEPFHKCTIRSNTQWISGFISNHHFVMFLPFSLSHSADSDSDSDFDYEDWKSSVDTKFSRFGFKIEAAPGLVINKCGVRVVCHQDVEELIHSLTSEHQSLWCHSCTVDGAESGTSGNGSPSSVPSVFTILWNKVSACFCIN